jgi:hypothetical protein
MYLDITTRDRYSYGLMWQEFVSTFCLLNREAELMRLIGWATRKRLSNPRRLYERHLADTQTRLMRVQWRAPGAFTWAQRCQGIAALINPAPRYMQKGSAAAYRQTWVDVPEEN